MIRYYSVPKETFVTNGTIVEPLNVTENGTYAPPAGTAYSPVVVNVEGGGGSSDFSTAEVTFSSDTFQTDFGAIQIDENDILFFENVIFGGQVGDKTCKLVLYKGLQIVSIPEGKTATVTGNATVEEETLINITGDCTITIS